MSTSNLIKNLCKEKGISVAELARRIGQTPQNFNKKLKRETVSTEELMEIYITMLLLSLVSLLLGLLINIFGARIMSFTIHI